LPILSKLTRRILAFFFNSISLKFFLALPFP
jgi:hypothetical protein